LTPDSSPTASDFVHVATHIVLDYPEYRFEIDEHRRGEDQMLMAHLCVNEWSREVLKKLLREWLAFRKCVTAPLFACAEVDDKKWEHFVSLLGFKFHSDIICNNGAPRRLFMHVKDCP
jgi:hypothetical protein